MPLHECDRFRLRLGECPFAGFGSDDDEHDIPEHKPPFIAFPGKRPNTQADEAKLPRLLTIAHSEADVRKALERIAAIQTQGQLAWIESRVTSSLLEHGPRGIMAALTAIVLTEVGRRYASTRTTGLSQTVRTLERRVSGQLQQVRSTTGRGGRGGFHVNAAADLAALTGLPLRRFRDHSRSSNDPGGQELGELGVL